MRHTAKMGSVRLLVLLAILQGGCLAESDPVEVAGECGPRDLTPECCLKRSPGQWERCTGVTEMAGEAERTASAALKLAAGGVAGVMAVQSVRINSAERRGAELATDLLAKVEKAIVRCVREANQQVNDYHFDGRSPGREICEQLKVGERTTWAAYLGLFKHEQSWPCLREALDKLIPGRYRLAPRFRLDDQTEEWVFLEENTVREIVAQQGWKGLKGTIEPDIILLDEKGFIVHVYDLKFPCPETRTAAWSRYEHGRWKDWSLGELYEKALQVKPRLVSPKHGLEAQERQ